MCKRYITASDVLLTFLLLEKGLFLCFFCHAITVLLVELSVCLAGQNDKIRIDGKHPFIELLNYLVALCSADTPILTDFCNIYIHLFIHRLIPPFFVIHIALFAIRTRFGSDLYSYYTEPIQVLSSLF